MRRSSESVPHRRGHTKWLMIAPATALVLVISGIIWLEALAPQPGPSPQPIPDLPGLAVTDDRACTRGTDEAVLEDLRDQHRGTDGRISSSQVFACPLVFDQLPVTYAGEVVGDLLPRRGGAWAQVNDDLYALEVGPLVGHKEIDGFNSGLAVWFPDGLHERIGEVGRPGRRGDVVLVHGTLLRADPADGGGITLRAEEMEILAASVEVDDPLHTVQLIVAALAALGALAAVVWARRSR